MPRRAVFPRNAGETVQHSGSIMDFGGQTVEIVESDRSHPGLFDDFVQDCLHRIGGVAYFTEHLDDRSIRARHCDTVRILAKRGRYLGKTGSRFGDMGGYLPLDLWDSTPDP